MNELEKRFHIYSKILHLYPQGYRESYAQELLQTTADMLDETENLKQRLSIWLQIAIELPRSVSNQQFINKENYMKVYTRIALALFILGFLFVDFIFFHDIFKPGETTSVGQLLTGILSIPVLIVSTHTLLKRNTPSVHNKW